MVVFKISSQNSCKITHQFLWIGRSGSNTTVAPSAWVFSSPPILQVSLKRAELAPFTVYWVNMTLMSHSLKCLPFLSVGPLRTSWEINTSLHWAHNNLLSTSRVATKKEAYWLSSSLVWQTVYELRGLRDGGLHMGMQKSNGREPSSSPTYPAGKCWLPRSSTKETNPQGLLSPMMTPTHLYTRCQL